MIDVRSNEFQDLAYHYAVGYNVGYTTGTDEELYPDTITDTERHARRTGYDRGVADYCDELES